MTLRRRLTPLLLAAALVGGCASSLAPRRLMVAVGDSITAGYMAVDGTVHCART